MNQPTNQNQDISTQDILDFGTTADRRPVEFSFCNALFPQCSRRLLWGLKVVIAVLIQWLFPGRSNAQDHVDYRYEFYKEDGDRMEINTHSVLFEKRLVDALSVNGELVYDGISGATPTGAGHKTTELEDIRRALNFGLGLHLGNQTLSPSFAYSKESDYESYGISLNDAIEFNDKNTTLRFGIAHDFDQVLDFPLNGSPRRWRNKENTQGLIGISQLLDSKTIVTGDFT